MLPNVERKLEYERNKNKVTAETVGVMSAFTFRIVPLI